MTEDEAKKLVCCGPQMVATAMAFTAPRGTVELLPTAGRCIASACMAWRWNPTADQVRAIREAAETHVMDAKRLATAEQRPAVNGYCGLAGAPQ